MSEVLARAQDALQSRYRIERELGQGGMATVYLAEDLKHHRMVAVKVLRPELAASLGPGRFLREVEITAQLAHPHIVPLLDSGEADGLLYYVMPLVEGESLRERLDREHRLSLAESVRITREVAEALASAHSRGFVHRDIKPENILLEEGHAVVSDFGVARAASAAAGQKLTATGFAVGTPAYMSPEQAYGDGAVDGRSDLYSLACVLYEMLGGDPPFTGSTPDAIIARKVSGPIPSLRVVRETVPDTVERVVTRALAKVPADRFATVVEFAEALESAAAEGPAVPTAAPSAGRQKRRWTRRPWIRVTAASVAAVAAGLLWFAWPFLSGPQIDPRRYEKSLAVLYLEDESPEELGIRFGDGLTEELISRLSAIRTLRVVPRIDVLPYRLAPTSSEQIARDLGVDAILEGTVRIAGSSLQVSVQLIDAKERFVLWSQGYRNKMDQIFVVQDQIASQIVAALDLELSSRERQRLLRNPTSDITAYQEYLRGEGYLTQWTFAALDTAIGHLEAAVARDDEFAEAHAYLAFSRLVQVYFGYASDAAVLDRVRASGERALALDPENEVALISTAGANLLRVRRGDRLTPLQLRDMLVRFRRLVALNPNSPLGNLGIAHYYLWFKGDSTRAKPLLVNTLSRADAALEVEPQNRFLRGIAAEASGILAQIMRSEGSLQGAIDLSARSIGYVGTVSRTYSQLARYRAEAGEADAAAEWIRTALSLMPTAADSGQHLVNVGAAYYRAKRFPEAIVAFRSGFDILGPIGHPNGDYALLYWVILTRRAGRSDEAERALATRAASAGNRWIDHPIRLYAGTESATEVIRAARRIGQQCEAQYLAGAHAALDGRLAEARDAFRASVATGATSYLEHSFARVELELLDAPR